MKSILNKYITDFNEELIEMRKHFHRYPELGLREVKTSKKIFELLRKWDIEAKFITETGVVGLLRGSKPGKTIAIRTDIDALPIKEQTGLDFASKHDGVMHACGHDGHITMCLGAAKILSDLKDSLSGNVKFIFQPAEEGPGGAKMLIDEGIMANPKVDAIIGLHIWPQIEKGSIGILEGPIMAAADRFDIEIIGKGGHGAIPQLTVDPIVTACQVVTALQTFSSREVDPLDCVVVSNCMFHGGDAFNIIPNKVLLSGTSRYHNPELTKYVPRRMEEMVSGITKAMRCEYKFKYSHWYPVTINNKDFNQFFSDIATDILGKEHIVTLKKPSMGAEDFSFYLNEVPGTFFFLGTRDQEHGFTHSLHHPEYYFDEEILPIGVELFCNTVVRFLNE